MLSKEQQPSTSTSPIPPMSQKEQTVMAPAPQSDKDHYATGFKLALILASMTLVFFLMMLDMSILATVRHPPCTKNRTWLTASPGDSVHHG